MSGFVRSDSRLRGSLVAWSPQACTYVLPEVSDALDICWNIEQTCWQVLSPIYGVLSLQRSVASDTHHMSAAPLLEAAVSRFLAGVTCHLPSPPSNLLLSSQACFDCSNQAVNMHTRDGIKEYTTSESLGIALSK